MRVCSRRRTDPASTPTWPTWCTRRAGRRGSRSTATAPGQAHPEGKGNGQGSSAYPPRTDPREREHDRFAREVAARLDEGISRGECAGLVLVASNPFLGHLKAHLSARAQKAILNTVAADYTALRDDELARQLGAT